MCTLPVLAGDNISQLSAFADRTACMAAASAYGSVMYPPPIGQDLSGEQAQQLDDTLSVVRSLPLLLLAGRVTAHVAEDGANRGRRAG